MSTTRQRITAAHAQQLGFDPARLEALEKLTELHFELEGDTSPPTIWAVSPQSSPKLNTRGTESVLSLFGGARGWTSYHSKIDQTKAQRPEFPSEDVRESTVV